MVEDLLPSMWFQPGFRDNDVVVILNSPGRDELLANRPAVGTTGHNLESLLSKVSGVDSRWSLCRRSVEIINASRVSHYPGSPDGERIKKEEVLANVEFARVRLMSDRIRTVLVFGKRAQDLVGYCLGKAPEKCVCVSRHLDDRGLINNKLSGGLTYPWPPLTRNDCSVVEWRIECLARFITDSWGMPGIHCAEEYFKTHS